MKRNLIIAAFALFGLTAGAQHQQVALKYKYADLEPYIDSTTMRIHYSLHHAAYTKNLNSALEKYADYKQMPLVMLLKNINALPADIQTAVRNNGGGVYNHNLFFEQLTVPSKSVMPDGLKKVFVEQFGSVEAFKEEMGKAAMARFGSGWAWLLVDASGKMKVVSTANQDAPIMDVALTSGYPLMNIDVWEHAYYLKYKNKRAEYLKNIWNVVDWNFVYDSYRKALGL